MNVVLCIICIVVYFALLGIIGALYICIIFLLRSTDKKNGSSWNIVVTSVFVILPIILLVLIGVIRNTVLGNIDFNIFGYYLDTDGLHNIEDENDSEYSFYYVLDVGFLEPEEYYKWCESEDYNIWLETYEKGGQRK